jgi:hypothetical protein
LSYDHLDRNVSLDVRKRGLLISALIEFWQRMAKRLPRVRAKIFLREDIWSREINVTDKSKIRDGIDRGTIKWEAVDIYRAVLKRMGHVPAMRELLRAEGLWRSEFDAMLTHPLGFNPPNDEEWVKKCVQFLAGETMAPGQSGHKKGYVYTWVIRHISDAEELVRPRNALLLFAEAAKLQKIPQSTGALLDPRKFGEALRGVGKPGQVSVQAVDDLRQEYRQEWSIHNEWLPDTFKTFPTWPVPENALIELLCRRFAIDPNYAKEKIELMSAAGLLERRAPKGQSAQLQIPDIYLFGLELTRKG